VSGKVVGVSKDGKTLMLEGRGDGRRARDEAPPKVEIHLNDKTVLAFHGVAKGGAKITEGYQASIVLEDGSKDTAAIVEFYGSEPQRRRDEKRPDLAGKIVAAAKDGSTVTIEQPARTRGDDPQKLEIKLDDKASLSFNNVVLGAASMTEEGQSAMIWLRDGSKDTAERVVVMGVVPDRYKTVVGKVVAVAKDGSSVTLETPAQVRGEEGKQVEIKINVNTQISFTGVGPNEAKIVEGLFARARLADGSPDTAAQIGFGKGGDRARR
jgi:hypothetical protein